ncbi:MAG: hypothetical protein H6Q72_1827 [Firmicutes bacterium]|nr:hypothetical protein [Bacillota bacterium]
MGYIIASFIAIFITTLIVYKVGNSLFGLGLRLKPILLCAVCAMLISLVLPKIIVGFAGLPATLAVLAIFAVVFAYFVARYEDMPQPDGGIADAQADSTYDSGDTLAASNDAADGETLQKHGSYQATDEIGGNASGSEVVSGEAEVLAQEISSIREIEVTGNNLNKGQLTPEEESLNDAQVSSIAKESGIVQADTLKDNSLDFQHSDEQENVDINLDEVGNVNESLELANLREPEVVENDFSEVETQEENNSLDELQSAVVNSAEHVAAEESNSVLSAENTNLEEEYQQEVANTNKSDEVDSQLAAEIVENELTEQVAEDVVSQSDDKNVSTDIELDSTEPDNLELRAENTDAVENNFADNEMNDITEELDQVEAEVLVQMPKEEIAGQVESPVAQAFVQEVDDDSMKHDELNVNPVQMETEELDDLIDRAFVCKETQDYSNAYRSFKKALALYPNSEAAPFLVVEIGNILKNKGDYDEAIKIFSEGRNLSHTKHDEMMEQEFISTIAYLRITKNILLQNRLGNIPFLEIPTQILNQIDEEFREWRSVGNI